ncbi:MAG: hypothetical protein E7474_10670 [Ruminococcaceae bacterium]|nr:hypothetical protein [Oscillospiraceae bacterium]
MDNRREKLGQDILFAARNELYMAMPYLDAALCSLRFAPGEQVTLTLATDGESLFYDGNYLAERYMRGRAAVNRAYLHTILHCMLRHLAKKRGRDAALWDLACDVAVESILDELAYPCLAAAASPARQKLYHTCRGEMRVLTAEGIYRYLLREHLPEYERAQLQRLFFQDDHDLWDGEDGREQSRRQDEHWQGISERTQTAMETVLAGKAEGGDAVLEQVRVSARDDVDYRAFLRRFAAPREIMAVDGDAFDYIYYTYGLAHYGNMPLIEPPETKEERRIEQLVIAVDTSMSTSGELVREFLRCTYTILRSTETFTRRLDIHIVQCDDQVRADDAIHSMDELAAYMDAFTLNGGSATDFRPVFEHVAAMQARGELTNLRGLIYFTDGMGIYPRKRPPYDTAFILLEEPPLSFKMPPWAIRLVLELPDLERANREAMQEWDEPADQMPEL